MPTPISFTCDASACLNFEPHSKTRIAYLQTFVIGPTSIPPDIMGAEPDAGAGSFTTTQSGSVTPPARGVFTKAAVGPLTQITWDSTRTGLIAVKFLCSSANRANLELMLRSTTVGAVCKFSFTVYEWDWVNGGFYARLATKAAESQSPPSTPAQGGSGASGAGGAAELACSIAADGDNLSISIPLDPTQLSGMTMWEFGITFKPPSTSSAQSLVIATSKKSKLLLPWSVAPAR